MLSALSRILVCILVIIWSVRSFAYEVSVKGTDDEQLTDNIVAHLSILTSPSRCEVSDNFRDNLTNLVTEAAQAVGYYNLSITTITLVDDSDCEELELEIKQGPQTLIDKVELTLQGKASEDAVFADLVNGFPLKQGDALQHHLYTQEKSKWLGTALARGYFDAKFSTQQIEVDVENNSAVIKLTFQSGDRYQFGELILPETLLAKTLIRQVVPFSQGDLYLAENLALFNKNLKLTGYFQQVVARPVIQRAQNKQVPIEIIASAKPRHIYNVGGGASTDTGPRVRLKWQRPWVNSAGHSMSAELFVSSPLQTATFNYKVPLEDPLDNYLSFQAGLRAIDDNDTNSETFTLAMQRHWGSEKNDWKKIAFVRYEQERFQQELDENQTTRLLIPGATLSRRRARGGLDVYWGDLQQVTLETASADLISDIDFTRLSMKSRWVRSFDAHRFLFRAELGAIATNDFAQVPSSLRYFAGGDQSVRGYDFGTLSPTLNGELVGGRYLSAASIEYSYPIRANWRLATFMDIGNASDEPFKNLARSAGIGASWLSPVGPIRLYLAWGKQQQVSSFRVHFSMGPAI